MSSVEASSTESEEDAGFDSPAQEDEFDAPLAKDRGVANIHTINSQVRYMMRRGVESF